MGGQGGQRGRSNRRRTRRLLVRRTRSKEPSVNDLRKLTELNAQFIEACRQGSWQMLEPLLALGFSYLDGATGEVWTMDRYVHDLEANPAPTLAIDQVRVHVAGDVGVVSARSVTSRGRYGRYVDTYQRRYDDWLCVHACVWPLVIDRDGD
jgi:Domain of unknown function (DUF4440)